MNLDTRYRIKSSRLIHENFENEIVIVDLDSGSYYSINQSGADVWSMIERRALVEDIVDELGRRYQAGRPEIESALGQFLAELQQEALIVPEPDAPQSAGFEPNGQDVVPAVFEAPHLMKYTDMQELLLLDPIHEVDDTGWPRSRSEAAGAAG